MNELRLELRQEEQVIYDEIHSEKEESQKRKSNPRYETKNVHHSGSIVILKFVNAVQASIVTEWR